MKSTVRMIFCCVCTVLMVFQPFFTVHRAYTADGNVCREEAEKLKTRLEKRLKTRTQSCSRVEEIILQLYESNDKIRKEIDSLSKYYQDVLGKLTEEYLAPFSVLQKEHSELKYRAYIDNVIVPDDVRARYYKEGKWGKDGSGKDVILGIPVEAMSFDDDNIAKSEEYFKKQVEIFNRWEEESKKYKELAQKTVKEFNKNVQEKLETDIASLIKTHVGIQKKLEEIFYSREYEHCLGIPKARAVTYRIGDTDVYTLNMDAFEAKMQRDVSELPGMNIVPPDENKLREVFKPLEAPLPPPIPKQIHFVKNGKKLMKDAVEIRQSQLSADRWNVICDVTEMFMYPTQKARDLGKSLFIDMPVSMVKPLGNLADINKGWDQALADMTKDYLKLGKEMTIGTIESLAKNTCDTLDDLGKVIRDNGNALLDSFDNKGVVDTITDSFIKVAKGARNSQSKIGILTSLFIEPPKAGASAYETINYLSKTAEVLKTIEDTRKDIQATTKWLNQHVWDNLDRSIQAYLAFQGAKATAQLAINIKNKINPPYDPIAEVRSIRESVLKEKTLADEVLAKKNAGEPISQEAVKLAEEIKAKEVNKLVEEQKKLIEEQNKVVEEPQKVVEKPQKTPYEPPKVVERNEPTLGKELGRGTMKSTYDSNIPNEVIQEFNLTGKQLDLAIQRQQLSEARLTEAGVGFAKTNEIIKTPDGKVFQKVEKVDGASIAENLIKENKFTAEHRAALKEAMDKLNNNNMIATDPNPGNIYFERNPSGKLEAKFLDKDCS